MRLLYIHECSNTKKIDRAVLKDLQMDKLFSEKALEILRCPCRKEELLARQALLRAMTDENVRNIVLSYRSALRELEREQMRLEKAPSGVASLFAHVAVAERYLEACHVLAALGKAGGRFSDLYTSWKTTENEACVIHLESDCKIIRELLGRISDFDISCMTDKIRITKSLTPVSFLKFVSDAVSEMGLEVRQPKALELRVSAALAQGIEVLFAEELAQVRAVLKRYAELPVDWLLSVSSELDFLIEIQNLIQRADALGIPTAFPSISFERRFDAREVYDISLLAKDVKRIVPNDVSFSEQERFFFLTGANGGGKTSYLRAVGISLILFLAGCPIFARHAEGYAFGGVATHFPKDERFTDTGRLDEEKARIDRLLTESDEDVFLLLNESFSGTDEKQGLELALNTVQAIAMQKRFALFITHFHQVELAGYPMLTTLVERANGNARTYRIVKQNGEHSSFAKDILKKYRLDAESLKERRAGYGE